MSVRYEADSGRLRLDREAFRALAAWWSGPLGEYGEANPDQIAELREAGVIEDDEQLHPILTATIDAVAAPICRLSVRMRDGQGRTEQGDAWVNHEVAALLLDLPDGRCEFGAVHPAFLPVMLARVVELGPHPRLAAEPMPATPERLEQLTDPDPALRSKAAVELPAPGLAGLRRDWRIRVTWKPADGADGARALRVLDTPAGLWLVEPHPERVVLFPTTPTAIWRALVRLLPTDAELPLR
jgi:hypothetical protein